jgi:hypothetical protein
MRALLGLLALLPACGDPLAPGDFLGTPRVHLAGTIKGNPGYTGTPARPRMGVLWSVGGLGPDGGGDGDGGLSSAVSTSFPTQFQLDLFDAPEQLPTDVDPLAGPLAGVGFGRLVVIDDVDGDGWFSFRGGALAPPDLFIGAGPKHLILFVRRLGAPGEALRQVIANPERLTTGYQVARGLCGQDGEPDRLEVLSTATPVSIELVLPTSAFPVVAGCLRLQR